MKTKNFLLVVSLLYITNSILATDIETQIFADTEVVRGTNIIRPLPNKEMLKFKIQWEFVPAGESVMICQQEVINNKKVYHIQTNTVSNSSMDIIYKVRNKTDSYLDYENFYSLKFVKDQNEGGFVSKEYILFDNKNGFWYSVLENKNGPMPKFVFDIVSSLYYLRTQKLGLGEKYSINVFTGNIVYPMIVSVLKKEPVKIKDKIFNCIKVEPKIDEQKFPLFRVKGKLYVWLTDDERCVPVKLQTKIFIGSVYAILDEFSYN